MDCDVPRMAFGGALPVGAPLPFGLYNTGDSIMP